MKVFKKREIEQEERHCTTQAVQEARPAEQPKQTSRNSFSPTKSHEHSFIHTTLGLEFRVTVMVYSLGVFYDYDNIVLDALDMPR